VPVAVKDVLAGVTQLRHDLHMHPEIACKEFSTAERVRHELKELPLKVLPPFLQTDVVALLEGERPGPNVTLRADMDALPIAEETGVSYHSTVPGMMHACGHDGHTAMLVGAARVLARFRASIAGTVRFVFQPGEESVAAAKDLVAAGAIDNPLPALCVALHAWPGLPVGAIGTRPGPCMAAADFFRIAVTGRGGHGAMPHLANNPIPVAARIACALEGIPSGRVAATDPCVVSVCKFHCGTADNIIADTAELVGTVRYFDGKSRTEVPGHIKRLAEGMCAGAGMSCDIDYRYEYPATLNTPEVVSLGREVVDEALGAEAWAPMADPVMGAEDFAFFIRKAPGALFRLGMGESCAMLHNSRFDFNDRALENGIRFLVGCALKKLEKA
jgi:amidohydrolase